MLGLTAKLKLKGDNQPVIAETEKVVIGNPYFSSQLSALKEQNKNILIGMYETAPSVADLFLKLGLEVIESEIKKETRSPRERAEAMALLILGSKNTCLEKEVFLQKLQEKSACNLEKAVIGLEYMIKTNTVKITKITDKASPFYDIKTQKEVIYIENLF